MSAYIVNAPNINHLWARLMVEELVRNGVNHFVISPGSRSTPLALAAAEHPSAEAIIHFDERGAAFVALGINKSGAARKAALICTSGTAAANYFPAIIEAAQSNIGMIVLTADRPPELLHRGANQAIVQRRLFGEYARWSVDVSPPTTDIPASYPLSLISQALFYLSNGGGILHLNCQFREPLAPVSSGEDWQSYLAAIVCWTESTSTFSLMTPHGQQNSERLPDVLQEWMEHDANVLVLLGGRSDLAENNWLDGDSSSSGAFPIPILADVASGFRCSKAANLRIAFYDQILLSQEFRRRMAPRTLIQLGAPVVSKRTMQWIKEASPARYCVVTPHVQFHDPELLGPDFIRADTARILNQLYVHCADRPQSEALRLWLAADAAVAAAMTKWYEGCPQITEMELPRLVAASAPDDSVIFVGNSMPVRDMDMYLNESRQLYIAANRGASGIDGNIATSIGLAIGSGKPVTAVVGDLTALHDLNSMALASQLRTPYILIVINNDGGGIFHFLPVAGKTEQFEKVFGTAHGRRFCDAAKMFSMKYFAPKTKQEFLRAYADALESPSACLIEVFTDRAENVLLHRDLQKHIATAVDAVIGKP